MTVKSSANKLISSSSSNGYTHRTRSYHHHQVYTHIALHLLKRRRVSPRSPAVRCGDRLRVTPVELGASSGEAPGEGPSAVTGVISRGPGDELGEARPKCAFPEHPVTYMFEQEIATCEERKAVTGGLAKNLPGSMSRM